jgi:hypothetical protein
VDETSVISNEMLGFEIREVDDIQVGPTPTFALDIADSQMDEVVPEPAIPGFKSLSLD